MDKRGLIIGIERQIGGHHIEIKTTFLIAVGTFAFCMIEILLGYPDIRMSANIVTGIGFLCIRRLSFGTSIAPIL